MSCSFTLSKTNFISVCWTGCPACLKDNEFVEVNPSKEQEKDNIVVSVDEVLFSGTVIFNVHLPVYWFWEGLIVACPLLHDTVQVSELSYSNVFPILYFVKYYIKTQY